MRKKRRRLIAIRWRKLLLSFSLDGDLDAGLMLYVKSEEIAFQEDSKKLMKNSEKDAQNAVAEETWHLVQKEERGLGKLLRQTAGENASTPAGTVREIARFVLI